MSNLPKYVPFKGYLSRSDCATGTEANTRFTLKDMEGNPITLGSSDIVVLETFVCYPASTIVVQVYDGPDNTVAAGGAETAFTSKPGTAGNTPNHNWGRGWPCAAGTYPKIKTGSDVQIDATITGYVKQLS